MAAAYPPLALPSLPIRLRPAPFQLTVRGPSSTAWPGVPLVGGALPPHTKRRLYQEVGIPLYWLVDPDAKVVEVWTPEGQFPVTAQDEIRWHPGGAGEPLVIGLAALFREP